MMVVRPMLLTAKIAVAVLLTGCAPNPEGGLYALNCAPRSFSNPTDLDLDDDMLGMEAGDFVFDEKNNALYKVVRGGTGYREYAQDSCTLARLCDVKFNSRGFQKHAENRNEIIDLIYNRKAMTLSVRALYRNPNTGKTRQVMSIWACNETEFPDKLWQQAKTT